MAVSSDDDDASKVLLSELLQSSPVLAFNPLRADPLPANQYLTPQLLQLLLTTSKLQLLRHLRLCSIGSPLTRYSMCLSAEAIVHARSRRVSTRVRCSSLRLVVSRWRNLGLLSPPSRFLSTSCSLSVGSSSASSLLKATSSPRSASIIPSQFRTSSSI